MGRITPVMNYIRRILVEAVYGRLSKALRPQTTVHRILTHCDKGIMFPDSEAWAVRADE
jgi:hypothetical protein